MSPKIDAFQGRLRNARSSTCLRWWRGRRECAALLIADWFLHWAQEDLEVEVPSKKVSEHYHKRRENQQSIDNHDDEGTKTTGGESYEIPENVVAQAYQREQPSQPEGCTPTASSPR